MITVTIGPERTELEASTPMQALQALSLLPDAHIVLRDNMPIPLDEPLLHGDMIKIIRVASGG